jgi:hypothetical protein
MIKTFIKEYTPEHIISHLIKDFLINSESKPHLIFSKKEIKWVNFGKLNIKSKNFKKNFRKWLKKIINLILSNKRIKKNEN